MASLEIIRLSRTDPCTVAPKKAGSILRRNLYGWSARTERGVYRLTVEGEAPSQR